jgi:hypothetical protein
MDFFDKLKEGIDKGVKTVGVKSREMVDAMSIKNQLANLRDEKRTLLEELGRVAYAAFQAAPAADPAIREKCEGISALDQQIAEKERELEATHRKADEALAEAPGPPPAAAPAAPPAVCTCGAPLREDAKFCSACGKPLPRAATHAPCE